jgi:HEAT repeat protein
VRSAETALRELGLDFLPVLLRKSGRLRSNEAWAAVRRVLVALGGTDAARELERLRPEWPRKNKKRFEALLEGLRTARPDVDPGILERVRKELEPFRNSRSYSTENPQVRRIVAMGRAAVPALLKVLEEPEPAFGPGFYKEAASDAFAALVDEEDLPALARLLSEGILVAARCFRGLRSEAALDALLVPVGKGMMSYELLEALEVHHGEPRVQQALVAYLEKYGLGGGFHVGQVAEFLGEAGAFEAVPVLRRLLEPARGIEIRRPVANALVLLGERDAIPVLIEILDTPAASHRSYVRHAAGENLNRLVGRTVFLGRFEPGGEHTGNYEDAAREFRTWWETNREKLTYDRERRRFRVEGS